MDIFKRMILNEITRASESIPIGGNLRKNVERKWENEVVKENKMLLRYIYSFNPLLAYILTLKRSRVPSRNTF